MSISTHLTPDPEHRLLALFDAVRRSVERTEKKIGALTALAAAELLFSGLMPPDGPLELPTAGLLAAVLPLGVFAFSPLCEKSARLPFLEPSGGAHRADDCLISAGDIAKYSRSELVLLLDAYFGGGITATPYYEDIVGQIVVTARIATRKARLFRFACLPAGAAQLCLLAQVFR